MDKRWMTHERPSEAEEWETEFTERYGKDLGGPFDLWTESEIEQWAEESDAR